MYNFEDISPSNLPLEFVKHYLRIDHTLDDTELQVYIKAAQNEVRRYTKIPLDEDLDYELVIPTLNLISYFYENKSAVLYNKNVVGQIFQSTMDLNRRDIL